MHAQIDFYYLIILFELFQSDMRRKRIVFAQTVNERSASYTIHDIACLDLLKMTLKNI